MNEQILESSFTMDVVNCVNCQKKNMLEDYQKSCGLFQSYHMDIFENSKKFNPEAKHILNILLTI